MSGSGKDASARLAEPWRAVVDVTDGRLAALCNSAAAGPGQTAVTITGVERRPRGARGLSRLGLGRTLPLVALDVIAFGAGWAVPGTVASGSWSELSGEFGESGEPVLGAFLAAWCALIGVAGGYPRSLGGWPPVRAVLDAVARFTAAACLVLLVAAPDAARGLALAVPVAAVAALVLRAVARPVLSAVWRRPVRVLLVGGADAVEAAARRLVPRRPGGADARLADVRVVGRCVTGGLAAVGPAAAGPAVADHGVVGLAAAGERDDGAADDVLRRRVTATARAAGADLVLLADAVGFPAPSQRRLAWTLHACGVGLGVAAGPSGVAAHRMRVRDLAELPVLHVDPPVSTGIRRVLKSAFDRGGAMMLVVLLAPLMLAVAAAVRLSGPGPVIFRQERVGRYGERFVMLKFRSMRADAPAWRERLEASNDHVGGVLFKMRSDPRITRIGRLLRRMSLDELPQLVNVLRGEMSLVGPRPALPSEVERYEPDMLRRLLVRPGLTGLWQVSGRSDLDWQESVWLDLGYVENWSLGLDVRILCRTVRAVLLGTGAR